MHTGDISDLARLRSIRLVVMDIDGTLLDTSDAQVADVISSLTRSLAQYRRMVNVTVATGRAFHGTKSVLDRLHLSRRMPLICYNGALVCSVDSSTFIRPSVLSQTTIAALAELTLSNGLPVLVYCPDLALSPKPGTETSIVEGVHGYSRGNGPAREFNGLPVEWHRDASTIPSSASAALIPTPSELHPGFTAALHSIPGLSVTRSSHSYIEVRPSNANKGHALALVAASKQLSPDEILVIGDNDNDIEMLEWAGCSVAVANSTSSALKASDYVTTNASGAGVVETLRLLYDARRYR